MPGSKEPPIRNCLWGIKPDTWPMSSRKPERSNTWSQYA